MWQVFSEDINTTDSWHWKYSWVTGPAPPPPAHGDTHRSYVKRYKNMQCSPFILTFTLQSVLMRLKQECKEVTLGRRHSRQALKTYAARAGGPESWERLPRGPGQRSCRTGLLHSHRPSGTRTPWAEGPASRGSWSLGCRKWGRGSHFSRASARSAAAAHWSLWEGRHREWRWAATEGRETNPGKGSGVAPGLSFIPAQLPMEFALCAPQMCPQISDQVELAMG